MNTPHPTGAPAPAEQKLTKITNPASLSSRPSVHPIDPKLLNAQIDRIRGLDAGAQRDFLWHMLGGLGFLFEAYAEIPRDRILSCAQMSADFATGQNLPKPNAA